MDGVDLLPFLLSILSPTENSCIKGSVRETRPSNSALDCKEFAFYIYENLVMFKRRAKPIFNTTNVLHQFFPICAIVSIAYRPNEMESIPIL